jgi:hypothetical protein
VVYPATIPYLISGVIADSPMKRLAAKQFITYWGRAALDWREAHNVPKLPKDPTVKAVVAIIRREKGRGLVAKEILNRPARKGVKIEASTFRKHIAPQLKVHGIVNERARGAYYDATCVEST